MTSIPKLKELLDVTELVPAFDGDYGWLTMTELNLIDPNACRFEVLDESEFIDNTVFVLVILGH